MPKIHVDHATSLPLTDAIAKIRDFFENDADLKKIDPNIKFEFDSKSNQGRVNGSQFKAAIGLESVGKGSKVQVTIDLPLLLTPFKGKVEETLQKKLKKYLA